MPIAWVDVPDPKNPPAGAPKLSAANLARLALIEDVGSAGTPTGDALKAAFAVGELAYGETNVAQTVNGTTPQLVTGCDIVIPATTRPVKLTGAIPWIVADGITTIVVVLQDVTNGIELQRAVHDFPGAGTNAFRPLLCRLTASNTPRRVQMQASLYSGTTAVNLYNQYDVAFLLAEGI